MRTGTSLKHEHTHSQNRMSVIPTALRLGVDTTRCGRGVTLAIIDSGFYPHPDLSQPDNRIIAYHDVTDPNAALDPDKAPQAADWHGTMTAVAAAGNGFLSDGVYRGLASDARLVLVKVGDNGAITEANIERGLRWVIENKERYGIRIVSISLGGDADVSYITNAVDRAAEDAVKAGIVVVVAAGNSGCTENHRTVPPANAPSVITVGGYHDNNQLPGSLELYCSSYGSTTDGLIKPEIIAPAMWVAAPILPKTVAYDRAEALSLLESVPDYMLHEIARPSGRVSKHPVSLWSRAGLGDGSRYQPIASIRTEIESLLRDNKIVATHYQHVDGTSFAAPIVASVVALMLEGNPRLTPAAVKHLLISSAERIQGAAAIRQGFGVINAHRALREAARENHADDAAFFCPPRVYRDRLEFAYHNDEAVNVALAGDFNGWTATAISFARNGHGIWNAELGVLPPGRYRYKLVIDGEYWIEDPANAMKEPDEYGGFNSILHVS